MKTTLGLLPLLALSTALSGNTFAQTVPLAEEEAAQSGDIVIDQINVEGEGAGETENNLTHDTGIGRLPGTVQDTPQIVNVISQETMQQQGTQTLQQVLRNVPGVTMAIGEGNGGLNGDQFKIRGFEAKGDIYSDGLRDFGVYVRDSFAYEQVQVLKGPSSENFGMGTTGGAINTETKTAHLGNEIDVEGSIGSDPLGRAIVDVNRQINETSAVRVVGMGHMQDVADRDHVESDRAGVLAALALGIGTDLNWDLSYFYQHTDRTPDYGVPMVTPPGESVGRPITEFGVSRSNFYGKEQDRDISNVHALTSQLEWSAAEGLTLYNDTRLSYYDREFATSVPGCSDPTPPDTGIPCNSNFFNGIPTTISGYGGGNPAYLQESWGIQNITTLVAELNTGPFRHEVVAGVDLFYQDDHRDGLMVVGTKTLPDLVNPDGYDEDTYTLEKNPNNVKDANAFNAAVFVSDRIWLTQQLSVLAGVRFDYYDSEYDQTAASGTGHYEETTTFASPKASLIWEPTPEQTYYLTYATSRSPAGQFVTNAPNPINGNQPDLEPEENELFEAGAKVSLFQERLGLTAAVFQIDKSNARYSDNGNTVATGEDQRVRGFEIGITGEVTDAWTVGLAYTYLNSEIRSSTSTTASTVGNEVAFVPENAVSLWTTYELSKHFDLNGELLVGGGITYNDEYFTNSANAYIIPSNFSLDAFASYEFDKFRVALNGYNLTDELNYSAGFNNRAIPASGRTVMLTLGATF